MESWVIMMKKADFHGIAARFGVSPILARLMRNRELTTDEEIEAYLTGSLTAMHDPLLMKDMEKGAAILADKIRQKQPIRIIGDYDIDGVNAAYILLTGIRRVGGIVDCDIPDRLTDGYGMNTHLVTRAKESGIDTIVTVDNGIAAADAVKEAKERGMTVVVTDHHQVPYSEENGERIWHLPEADAVIDPHRNDCAYPYKELCGAAVAWKLVQVLYRIFRIPDEEALSLIENAAFATVGDVVSLTGENRMIVKEGLKRLKNTKSVGMQALITVCGLSDQPILAWHIGFVLGPCINASGRLDTAKRALALLTESDRDNAERLAGDLKALNENRKVQTASGVEEALGVIAEKKMENDKILVVYLPDCHESLAGIIAGRLRERFGRPAFVLTDSEEAVKGSGRSVESYSMYEELCKAEDLLLRFGGHPMAAGLSLKKEKIDAFRSRLNGNCSSTLAELTPPVRIDMELPLAYASEELVKELHRLEPFGKDNVKPLFALRKVRVTAPQILGKNRNVCKVQLTDAGGGRMDGLYFGEAEAFSEAVRRSSLMDLTYYPDVNEFRGKKTMQAVIKNYREHGSIA